MTNLNGLVLAGGKSSRMGSDKSALEIHGLPQVQYLANLLQTHVDEVYISARKDQKNLPHLSGMKIIADKFLVDSPLNGILSAMEFNTDSAWLVIAVDMPNISAEAIKTLIKSRNTNYVATCFEMPGKGGPDPLFAIWEARSAQQLKEIIADKTEHICPRFVLKTLGANIIKNGVPAKVLANLNTTEELKEFIA